MSKNTVVPKPRYLANRLVWPVRFTVHEFTFAKTARNMKRLANSVIFQVVYCDQDLMTANFTNILMDWLPNE